MQRCLNQTRREGEEQQRGGGGIHRVVAGKETEGGKEEETNRMEERRMSRDTDPRLLRLTRVYGPEPAQSYSKMLSKNQSVRAEC